jgi:late competence protein required for DNA uptake (superfamily II DNA/RNA helicase)
MTNSEVRTIVEQVAKDLGMEMTQIITGLEMIRNMYEKHTCANCEKEFEYINMRRLGADLYCVNCITAMTPTNVSQRLQNVD